MHIKDAVLVIITSLILVAIMMFGVVMTDNPDYEIAFVAVAAFSGWFAGCQND